MQEKPYRYNTCAATSTYFVWRAERNLADDRRITCSVGEGGGGGGGWLTRGEFHTGVQYLMAG